MANITSRGSDVRTDTVQHRVYLLKHLLNLSKTSTMAFLRLNHPDMSLERQARFFNVTGCPPIDNMEARDWHLCSGPGQRRTGNLSHILYCWTRLKITVRMMGNILDYHGYWKPVLWTITNIRTKQGGKH